MSRKILWGKYGGYEGPVYWGSRKYSADIESSLYEKSISLTSAAEGNCDAVNMYDRAICSVGSIQWIELGQFNVSNMIGKLIKDLGEEYVFSRLEASLFQSKAEFKQTPAGDWRFHMKSSSGISVPVDNEAASRVLFLGCSGREGTWTPAAKSKAELWCASIASLFETPEAAASQADFTISKLEKSFIWQTSRGLFFPKVYDVLTYEQSRWRDVVFAYYISYAVNLPAKADSILKGFLESTKREKWSKEWSIDLIHALTFAIGHWPTRFDAQIAEGKRLFYVEFPKSAVFRRKNYSDVKTSFPAETTVVTSPTVVTVEESLPVVTEVAEEKETTDSNTDVNIQEEHAEAESVTAVQPFEKTGINKQAVFIPVILFIGGLLHSLLQSEIAVSIKHFFSKIYHFFF